MCDLIFPTFKSGIYHPTRSSLLHYLIHFGPTRIQPIPSNSMRKSCSLVILLVPHIFPSGLNTLLHRLANKFCRWILSRRFQGFSHQTCCNEKGGCMILDKTVLHINALCQRVNIQWCVCVGLAWLGGIWKIHFFQRSLTWMFWLWIFGCLGTPRAFNFALQALGAAEYMYHPTVTWWHTLPTHTLGCHIRHERHHFAAPSLKFGTFVQAQTLRQLQVCC